MESLVVEEHVDGAGVCDLPGVVLLVLDTALSLLQPGVLPSRAEAGDEVRPGDEPVGQVVKHLQIYRHGMGRPCSQLW